jgi:putative addiction module component (TIGR02574 family)
MSDHDVLATALALSAPERARLAHELIVSLDEPEDPEAAEAWLAEIGRRAREVEEGSASLEEWSVVRDRLAARRRARRAP